MTVAERIQPTATPARLGDDVPRMTFEEFLEWVNEDTRAEWVDGKVEIQVTATDPHQEAAQFFAGIIKDWDAWHNIGGAARMGPYPMLLSPKKERGRTKSGAGREPDVLYLLPQSLERKQRQFVNGPADIAIEVISPESRRRDRDVKFFEYERAGVREYWMHDPDTSDAEFFRLDETGKYRRVPLENETIFRSDVLPGFWMDLAWLAVRPLPGSPVYLRAWGLIPTPPMGTVPEPPTA